MGVGGYAGIFLVIVATGAGFPLPEEVPLAAAGITAYREESQSGGAIVWPAFYSVCWLGVVVGDFILYSIGRRWGPGVLNRRWIIRVVPVATQTRVRLRFARQGSLVLAIARFTPGTRIPAFLMAGALRQPVRTFVLIDGVAAMLYVGMVFGLVYVLGEQSAAAFSIVREYQSLVAIAVFAAVACYIVYQFRVQARGQSGNERAPKEH